MQFIGKIVFPVSCLCFIKQVAQLQGGLVLENWNFLSFFNHGPNNECISVVYVIMVVEWR